MFLFIFLTTWAQQQYRREVKPTKNVIVMIPDGTSIGVVGAGLSADVRLIKNETEGSLFMWQDMLRGECMLLSLKTNRFIGLHPETGELYSADWPGTLPARKDGTVFEWRLVFDVNH
jgi:hypothetical protein